MTPKQREALIAVRDGEVEQQNMGYAAYRVVGANPTVIGRCVALGWVRWTKVIGGKAELTEAGAIALTPEA